ncbi:MAG: cysteine desulfurase, partial [Rhodospirillales bacterium]|nr:cysteine desulfurase [Rhodospirillales bacterium]
MCHTEEPGWDGLSTAPKNVKFDSDAQIVRRAREIYLHAGRSRAMPPPNAQRDGIGLSTPERRILAEWYEHVAHGS